MKALGVVRNLDSLGRVCLPKEVRRNLGIGYGDSIEIFMNEHGIVIEKYKRGCHCCNTKDIDLKEVNKIYLCRNCIDKFNR